MKRRGTVVGRALRVLGLVAVVVAIWAGGPWAFIATAGAVATVFGLTLNALGKFWFPRGGSAQPSDFAHTLDLLRRAYDGRAAWATGLADGDIAVPDAGDPTLAVAVWDRGAALVELAAADGRCHIVREEPGTFVAVGDFPYGAGVLLNVRETRPDVAAVTADELRRLVAGMRLAEREVPEGPGTLLAKQLARVAADAASVEGVARAGAQFAQQLTQRATAIVLREAYEPGRVAAVAGADRRLEGLALQSEAPAARAIDTGVPVASPKGEDVFGSGTPERRRREREGVAYPLVDGHFAVGALVVVGPPIDPASPLGEQLGRFVVELGPRLAATRALREAERRAITDPLTGLNNRVVLEQRIREITSREHQVSGTVVYVDLDHFKTLNDTHGHAAGDQALRHVADIFRSHIRGRDLAARMGGEEFALWLPGTPLEEGVAVAERIRRSVETLSWTWAGVVWPLTVSCGVAAIPDHAQDVGNLLMLADKALYQAKQSGRNRVEKAASGR
jgi:diguanylate cyclase (GGDEF)-like protein